MTGIVLLGAPGSGKGTQAQRLESRFAIPQVSSGDLLRDAVARGTQLGLKAKAAMDAGQLVSDDIVLGLIRERLGRPDARRGFILDGYPRNADQAEALEKLLSQVGQALDVVVLLDVSRDLLNKRLTGRRTCRACGRVFNVYFSPPGTPPHCDRCDDEPELFQRPDDREDVIEKRLEVYEAQTRPLIEHYARKGLLQVVKGEGPLENVFDRMQSVLLGAGATVPVGSATGRSAVASMTRPRSAAGRAGSKAAKTRAGKAGSHRKAAGQRKTAAKQAAGKRAVRAKPAARQASGAKAAGKSAGRKQAAATKTARRKSASKKSASRTAAKRTTAKRAKTSAAAHRKSAASRPAAVTRSPRKTTARSRSATTRTKAAKKKK